LPDLDEGEAASIRLALASGPDVLVLFDERAGRGVAHELALRLAGSAAVIGMARLRGLIPQGPYGCGFFCGVQPGWPPPRLRLCGQKMTHHLRSHTVNSPYILASRPMGR
jgi:hypothetical protein